MNIELFWKIEIYRKVLNTNDFRTSDDDDQMKFFSNYGIGLVSKDHLSNGGSRISQTIIWQKFCRKLHDTEKNWTERGGASLAPPLFGSANGMRTSWWSEWRARRGVIVLRHFKNTYQFDLDLDPSHSLLCLLFLCDWYPWSNKVSDPSIE